MHAHALARLLSQGERRAGFVGLPLPGVRVKVAPDADAPRGADPDPSGGLLSAVQGFEAPSGPCRLACGHLL